MKRIICIALSACAMAWSTGLAQDLREGKQDVRNGQTAKEILETGNYRIDVDYMNPMQGPGRALTDAYALEVRNDSVYSYLPYVGQAHNLPYGGGEALNFNAPIRSYETREDKQGKVLIDLDTRSEEDFYTYTITVYPDGKARIQITPTNRQPISFNGRLELKK